MLLRAERLGEQIAVVLVGTHVEQFHQLLSYPVTDEVIADVNVFRALVVEVLFLSHEASAHVIHLNRDRLDSFVADDTLE